MRWSVPQIPFVHLETMINNEIYGFQSSKMDEFVCVAYLGHNVISRHMLSAEMVLFFKTLQETTFDILKFSMIASPGGHKQS